MPGFATCQPWDLQIPDNLWSLPFPHLQNNPNQWSLSVSYAAALPRGLSERGAANSLGMVEQAIDSWNACLSVVVVAAAM